MSKQENQLSQSNIAGKIYLIFLGICLIAIGGVFMYVMWQSFQKANATRQWDEVPCVLLVSQKGERVIPNRNVEYQWQGKFQFSYQGASLIGTKLEPRGAKWTSKEEKVDAMLEKYKQGSTTICFVNPEFPEEAILKHDSRGAGYSIWFPGLFVIGGVGMIIGVLMKKKGNERGR